MNQEQIKKSLLAIADAPLEFSVILSGKKSSKVNGIYKTDTREIVLHNRNFSGDSTGENLLIYTAIHEYAHHLHACARGGTLSARAHTCEFWAIFHELLEKAEEKKIYKNVFLNNDASGNGNSDSLKLEKLTALIKRRFLEENGSLLKEFGKLLLNANDLCEKIGGRFEDYVNRILGIPMLAAQTAIKTYQYDLDTRVGVDNMRYLAGIRNEDDRADAEKALLTGKSPDSVKNSLKNKNLSALTQTEDDQKLRLQKEKTRLERTIITLSRRLEEVEEELEKLHF
ncbi:MAG: hypothetical protein LBH07_08155 [Treponema sp.]|jgi:hypothetical protein|nr:hypothetical protein [Treponema sp.]